MMILSRTKHCNNVGLLTCLLLLLITMMTTSVHAHKKNDAVSSLLRGSINSNPNHSKRQRFLQEYPGPVSWAPLGQALVSDDLVDTVEDTVGMSSSSFQGLDVSMSRDGKRMAIAGKITKTTTTSDGTTKTQELGYAQVWEFIEDEWVQMGTNIDEEVFDSIFTVSVSLSADGKRVAVGVVEGSDTNIMDRENDSAHNFFYHSDNGGHVHVYEWNVDATKWEPVGENTIWGASGNAFGASLFLSSRGTRVAVGAPYSDDSGWDTGTVRVYELTTAVIDNDEKLKVWDQIGNAIHGVKWFDYSGLSLAMATADGSRMAVGEQDSIVRVYGWNGTHWDQVGQPIDGAVEDSDFEQIVSMSMDGNTLAISNTKYCTTETADTDTTTTTTNVGHVQIYKWTGAAWKQLGKDIVGHEDHENLGCSISLADNGKRIAIGICGDDANDAGQVKILEWDEDAKEWTQLGNTLYGQQAGAQTGRHVSMAGTGNRFVIYSEPTPESTASFETFEIYFGSAPVTTNHETSTGYLQGKIINITEIAQDVDGNLDPASVKVIFDPSRGNATANGDGTITYTPDDDFIGRDSFAYRVCDTDKLCDEARVIVNVYWQVNRRFNNFIEEPRYDMTPPCGLAGLGIICPRTGCGWFGRQFGRCHWL